MANYALGTLGGDPHETTGIIELGGASAQVYILPFLIFVITYYLTFPIVFQERLYCLKLSM